jgi:hypothetical protein
MKKGILIWALLTMGAAYATVSTAPAAPEQMPDPGTLASAQVPSEPQVPSEAQVLSEARTPAIEGPSDSSVIREAHSDGGYYYWERKL